MNQKQLFIAGFFLVLVVNAIVLGGVAWNRSGEPESEIILSDREVNIQRSYNSDFQNSGMSMRIDWRSLGKERDLKDRYYSDYYDGRSPLWLDEKKLEELGFDISRYRKKDSDRYQNPIEKEVFLVLENNGDTYRESVKRAERYFSFIEAQKREKGENEELAERIKSAEDNWKNEFDSRSRLFAIDAGTDAEKLREIYTDRTRYMITKGIVQPEYDYDDDNNNSGTRRMKGSILRLGVEEIHLPVKYANKIESLKKRDNTGPCDNSSGYSCFEVKLFYGKRFEPWIESIKEAKRM